MDVLVAMGTLAAYLYSSVLFFLGQREGFYFEASVVIITLIILGKLLEARAKGRTSEAIKKLAGLQAKTAHVIRDGKLWMFPSKRCRWGSASWLNQGKKYRWMVKLLREKPPVDESMLTGESMPVEKNGR